MNNFKLCADKGENYMKKIIPSFVRDLAKIKGFIVKKYELEFSKDEFSRNDFILHINDKIIVGEIKVRNTHYNDTFVEQSKIDELKVKYPNTPIMLFNFTPLGIFVEMYNGDLEQYKCIRKCPLTTCGYGKMINKPVYVKPFNNNTIIYPTKINIEYYKNKYTNVFCI